jgi:hypothetical protein
MSNNYTQFSFQIVVTKEQAEWLSAVHALCSDLQEAVDGEPPRPPSDPRFASAYTLIEQCIAGDLSASVEIDAGEGAAWFHADDCGDVEYTADLLAAMLAAFDSDAILSFTWANTCSKPRLDEFDGGAVVITKDDTKWLSPSRWIDEQVKGVKASRAPDIGNAGTVLDLTREATLSAAASDLVDAEKVIRDLLYEIDNLADRVTTRGPDYLEKVQQFATVKAARAILTKAGERG